MSFSLFRALPNKCSTSFLLHQRFLLKNPTQLHSKRGFFDKVSTHPKKSFLWWKDFAIVMAVFGVTGSASVYLTRPFISNGLGLEGSLKEGPWTYWVSYVLIGLPTYSTMLLIFGTLSGKGAYFKPIAKRMWTRLLPKRLAARIFN